MRIGKCGSIVVASMLFSTAGAWALPHGLGGAADYAVLGIGGPDSTSRSTFKVYQSDTVINGNVGEGPYSIFAHAMDGTINGRLDYDITDATPAPITGTVADGLHQRDMSSIVADAIAADGLYAALTPTVTWSTLTEYQTIVGNGGLNVIRLTDAVALKKGLTLQGTASDSFVFQITTTEKDPLTLSGIKMTLAGDLAPGNILWNLSGAGGDVSISSGASVYGTFLAPYRNILSDHGSVNGRLIGGGTPTGASKPSWLSVHSGSEITSPPTAVPDGGATAALLGLAMVGMRCLRGRSDR